MSKGFSAGGVDLDIPVMIGAGVCKAPASIAPWMESAAGAVVSGSYTPKQQAGNEGKLFFPDSLEEFLSLGYGLNSFGMPNMGFARAEDKFFWSAPKKPLIVSIAGYCPEDYMLGIMELTRRCKNISAIECNFGCPNVDHGGRIMSFDLKGLDALMYQLADITEIPIWFKFSPYSDPAQLKEVAQMVNGSRTVRAVVTCNTFPSAYYSRDAITPRGGLAGLSGPAMKPIALGQVVQWREHLRDEIDVIGVGGITTGDDVVDFLNAGARAVQVVSLAFWSGEPRRLGEMLMEHETSHRFAKLLADRM